MFVDGESSGVPISKSVSSRMLGQAGAAVTTLLERTGGATGTCGDEEGEGRKAKDWVGMAK